ncbi:MAG: hypothetical protein J6Y34_06655, partial [Bacteroidales bacterium]|nr:hypothetical protein [Bacteroidales bacterium]
ILYVILFIFAFGSMAFLAYEGFIQICAPLRAAGLGWLHFSAAGMTAILFGMIISIFTTYSGIYNAKDNDLLFSLPIPPRHILLTRMAGSYFTGLLFEALVLVPAIIAYWQTGGISVTGALFALPLLLIIGLLVLTLGCWLGWLLAAIGRRFQRRTFVTIVVSLAFMVLYFYGYNHATQLIGGFLSNMEEIGGQIRGTLYPFYQMGLAFEGEPLPMLLFCGMVMVLFIGTYIVMSRSLLRFSTTQKGGLKHKKYSEQQVAVAGSPEHALLRKEAKRLVSSATYMLNGALGSFVMPVLAVLALVKADALQEYATMFPADYLPLGLAAAMALLCTTNMLSSSSISMEGKSLWIVRSLPLSGWQILKAKWKLHMLVTLVPAICCCLAAGWALRVSLPMILLAILFTTGFCGFSAALGLAVNLRRPNLNWTNETAAVKQNFGSMICMYAEWLFLALPAGALVIWHKAMNRMPDMRWFMAITTLCFLLLCGMMLRHLKRKGAERLEKL